MTPFLGGLAEFFIPSHLLVVVAVGLLVGQRARRLPLPIFAVFAIGLILGSVAIASGLQENSTPLALLVLAAISAGLVALAAALPRWLAGLMAFAAGVALPFNAPPHEITIANAVAWQAGLGAAAMLVFAAIAFADTYARAPWQRVAIRVVASWIAASTIIVLALRLAR